MKKILGLLGVCAIFTFAACGGIDVNLGEDANAQSIDCANGGGGSGGTGGDGSCACECKPETLDGTRLKAQWIIGEDGSRMQSPAWFDSELNDTCYFQSLPTGETRCVPPAQPLNSYVDPGCTVPALVLKNECDAIPKYARLDRFDYSPNACSGPKTTGFTYVSFDTVNPAKGVSNIFALDANGQCQAIGGVPLNSGWRIYLTYPIHDGSWFVKTTKGVGF